MAHCICRTDKMTGTTDAAALVNLKLHADVDNGNVVLVGALADGEREAYSTSVPAKDSKLNAIALVCAPEVPYDERKKNLNEFYNEADAIVRGYIFHNGDEFSITADGFDGTPAKGNLVELQAGVKLNAVASATTGCTAVGTIVAVEGDFYVIRVAC